MGGKKKFMFCCGSWRDFGETYSSLLGKKKYQSHVSLYVGTSNVYSMGF